MYKNYTRWIGLVTAIEFDSEKTDRVKVYFDMFDRHDVSDTYTFTDIFGRGKANFDRFLRVTCEIDENGIAIPKTCVGSRLAILVEHKRGRIVGFCPLNEKELKLNLDYIFLVSDISSSTDIILFDKLNEFLIISSSFFSSVFELLIFLMINSSIILIYSVAFLTTVIFYHEGFIIYKNDFQKRHH